MTSHQSWSHFLQSNKVSKFQTPYTSLVQISYLKPPQPVNPKPKTILSSWGSAYFQGRTCSFRWGNTPKPNAISPNFIIFMQKLPDLVQGTPILELSMVRSWARRFGDLLVAILDKFRKEATNKGTKQRLIDPWDPFSGNFQTGWFGVSCSPSSKTWGA